VSTPIGTQTRAPVSSVPQRLSLGVIRDARRRQRTRRTLCALILLLLVVAVWANGLGGGHAAHHPQAFAPIPRPSLVSPLSSNEAMLSEAYLGVSCPGQPNSIACDRVGLAVKLRRPAVAVRATIGPDTFELHGCGEILPCRRRTSLEFAGFLQRPGLFSGLLRVQPKEHDMWYGGGRGSPVPHPKIRLQVTYPSGHARYTTAEVALAAGWG
jgi:hypothetical protein